MPKDLALRLKRCLDLRHERRESKRHDHGQLDKMRMPNEADEDKDVENGNWRKKFLVDSRSDYDDAHGHDIHSQQINAWIKPLPQTSIHYVPASRPSAVSTTRASIAYSPSSTSKEPIQHSESEHHPGTATAKPMLEGFERGAWWDVELLGVETGRLSVHFLGYGDKTIDQELLRYRSRRAYDKDCDGYLEPGMDVAFYSMHPYDLCMQTSYAWYDGKLISVERKAHKSKCLCKFKVQFYSVHDADILQPPNLRPLIPGKVSQVTIDCLGILQKSFVDAGFMQEEMTRQRVNKVIWSVDSKALPWPILSDFSRSFKLSNECRDVLVYEPKSTQSKRDCGALEKASPQSGHGLPYVKECNTVTCNERALGVDMASHAEQASLVQTARVEPREMLVRRNVSSIIKKTRRTESPSSSSNECGCSMQDEHGREVDGHPGYHRQADASQVKQGQSQQLEQVETGHYLGLNGLKSFMDCRLRPSQQELQHGLVLSNARKQDPPRFLSKESIAKQVHSISLLIDPVIRQKKRGWQRRLSILISVKLRLLQAMAVKKPYHTSSPIKQNRAHVSNGLITVYRQKSPSLKEQDSSQPPPQHRLSKMAMTDKAVKDAKLSFKELFERVLEWECDDATIPRLDWKKLSSILTQKEGQTDNRPTCTHTTAPESHTPIENGRQRLRKYGNATRKRNVPGPNNSIIWKAAKWSFHELLKQSREDNQVLVPDWTKLPPKRAPGQEVPWDPIIFYQENAKTYDNQKNQGPLEPLWHDMELASAMEKLDMEHKQEHDAATKGPMVPCEGCHDFVLQEDEGLVCQSCGLIGCGIELMLPPVEQQSSSKPHQDGETREVLSEDEVRKEFGRTNEDGEIHSSTSFSMETIYHTNKLQRQASVWDLIPELRDKMHPHQRDGFEFLWKSLAGSMGSGGRQEKIRPDKGGCIISHAPGTGKSFLIICFLRSYLQLNPSCRPLILCPTIMLRPWQLEFKKWGVHIPVHVLNSNRDSKRKSIFKTSGVQEKLTLPSGSRVYGQNLIDLHRIRAISEWFKETSILMVSYALFVRLTDDGSSRCAAMSRNIGQLLLQSPGLLILDEGHIARSRESKLRRGLMRIRTQKRILLSGTIFQNNCIELFNTFHLIRPTFMKEVFQSQRDHMCIADECMHSQVTGPTTRSAKQVAASRISSQHLGGLDNSDEDDDKEESLSCLHRGTEEEARERRLFMMMIGKTLEHGQCKRGKLLEGAIEKLRSMTHTFVHYYAGDVLKSLPGLKDFTIFLKPSPLQEKLLNEVLKVGGPHRTFGLEYVHSNICIHPYLFKHVSGKEGCTKVDIESCGDLVADPKEGIKVKFVMDLLRLCRVRKEKLLVFSQHIQPLDFLEDSFKSDENALNGDQVLKLHGDLPIDDRQGIIERFNRPSGNVRVLLASIKACGEGITLTGASRVVFLDTLWNPAVTKQAMSRAFRLGQGKEVFVYRLVASGTWEEEKYKRTIWKDWLSRSIFESSMIGNETSNNTGHQASRPTSMEDDAMASQGKDGQGGISFEEDAILGTILGLEGDDKRILRVEKHERCLDQGDMVGSDSSGVSNGEESESE